MSNVENELRAALDAIEAAFARGVTPAELMELMYYDEIVAVGEGDASAQRGFAEVLNQANAMVPAYGPKPFVRFRISSPILATEALAVAMIDTELRPDVPGAAPWISRMMSAWRPGPRGWRIVREMYQNGSL